ncbi:2,3-diketo-L-gulonate TRAP transporter small permease protein YiaM [Vibrio celticus]|uniref:TRAP transporter small permease protein n=2 Tax=Vibrio celticus TaxID=446372 RepID=A0A1C3JL42_9VIBR|nr:2,3-diketo-L-gulonate TRAP transporter small permease protein YiaM [Vibrio celticus]
MLNNIRRIFDKTIGVSVSMLTIALVVCVVWQVISRFILHSPSTTTDEIARFLLMWCGLTGSAYMVGQHQHLAIEVLGTRLKGVKKLSLNILVQLFIAKFSIMVMIYGGMIQYSNISMTGQLTPSLGLPMSYIYVVVPISGLIILIYNILNILDNVKDILDIKSSLTPSQVQG